MTLPQNMIVVLAVRLLVEKSNETDSLLHFPPENSSWRRISLIEQVCISEGIFKSDMYS